MIVFGIPRTKTPPSCCDVYQLRMMTCFAYFETVFQGNSSRQVRPYRATQSGLILKISFSHCHVRTIDSKTLPSMALQISAPDGAPIADNATTLSGRVSDLTVPLTLTRLFMNLTGTCLSPPPPSQSEKHRGIHALFLRSMNCFAPDWNQAVMSHFDRVNHAYQLNSHLLPHSGFRDNVQDIRT